MHASYLGPEFSDEQIRSELDARGCVYRTLGAAERPAAIAQLLAEGKLLGLFQGRMEFGPRALGNRSILADPTNPDMQRTLNQRIKMRENFRPFAPAVLAEHAAEWFEMEQPSPYMLFTVPLVAEHRIATPPPKDQDSLEERLGAVRSRVPAVTHVDYSARVQTIHVESHPELHRIVSAFRDRTGVPMVLNTSFNVRGEPIVCTPADALRCFMRTALDGLVIGPFLLFKSDQPRSGADESWRETIRLD